MDLRQIKTERNIQQALVQLLSEQDFEKITIADIAKTAQISRSTFYDHYPDKYALLDAVMNYYTDYLLTLTEQRIDALLARDRVAFEASIADIADHLLARRQTLSVLFALDLPGYDLRDRWKQRLQAHWHEVVESKGLTVNPPTPSSYISDVSTDLLINFAQWTLAHGKNAATIDQLQKLLSLIFDQLIVN
ncbi:TetR/AcrR family transcriptional regulator [Lacticaseibacillus brantae]|uniref:HTH tetR-type domain-containing protein n=1 Tax=Lacticaseibacillus brantae DSM 23927 TaxID=1423727 RepID=A0A0R2AY26_9LACO|nr:TetR/AcrR family transcriptional regulator [Lacticaseibacillus brantae]KRM71823.1 hypothetical protein FC34_GL001484 [Lacticaseibacillus brantae DSM 23927]